MASDAKHGINHLYPTFASYTEPGANFMPEYISLEVCSLRERLNREMPFTPVTEEEAETGGFTISAEELRAAQQDATDKFHLRNLVLAIEHLYPDKCPEGYIKLGQAPAATN